ALLPRCWLAVTPRLTVATLPRAALLAVATRLGRNATGRRVLTAVGGLLAPRLRVVPSGRAVGAAHRSPPRSGVDVSAERTAISGSNHRRGHFPQPPDKRCQGFLRLCHSPTTSRPFAGHHTIPMATTPRRNDDTATAAA